MKSLSSHPQCATHRCSYVPPPPKQPIQRRLPHHLSLLAKQQFHQQQLMAIAVAYSICTAIPALITIHRCHVHRLFIPHTLHRPAAAVAFRRIATIAFQIMFTWWAISLSIRRHQLRALEDRHPLFPDQLIHSLDLFCRRLGAMSPFGSSQARRSNSMSR